MFRNRPKAIAIVPPAETPAPRHPILAPHQAALDFFESDAAGCAEAATRTEAEIADLQTYLAQLRLRQRAGEEAARIIREAEIPERTMPCMTFEAEIGSISAALIDGGDVPAFLRERIAS